MKKNLFYKNENTKFSPQLKQGWKIHISAFFDNRKQILDIVKKYCYTKKLSFKYISNDNFFKLSLSKVFHKTQAGKFITIYPKSIKIFHKILKELYEKLKNFKACEIMGDKMYRKSIIQYRYGSFYSDYLNDGEKDIIDHRKTFFTIPTFLKKN